MFTFLLSSVTHANAAELGSPISSADCSNPVTFIKEKHFKGTESIPFSVLSPLWKLDWKHLGGKSTSPRGKMQGAWNDAHQQREEAIKGQRENRRRGVAFKKGCWG